MKPSAIFKRIKVPWVPQRDKRVERLGGYPAEGPQLAVERFEPVLNHQERLVQALGWVSRLGPESVDEATGHPLDNLVNAQSDEWQRRLAQQHHAYQAMAQHRLLQAKGIVEQYRHLQEQDAIKLQAAGTAVESAMLALSGQPPQPAADAVPGNAVPEDAVRTGRHGSRPTERPGLPPESTATGPRDMLDGPAALAPPRVSRTELRRIFDPQDAKRVPRWGEPGFHDGTLLGGRPRSTYLHVLALLLAAGADIGAFTQVVELALPEQSNWIIYLVVGGLTSVVLYIAHMIGVMLREAKASYPSGTSRGVRVRSWLAIRVTAAGCAIVWVALGLLAYWVRMTVPLIGTAQLGGGGGIGSGAGAGIGGGATTGGNTSGTYTHQSAAIFLGLFLATGIVAAVGAYFTHNPYRGRYVAAMRAHRKASERAAASAYQFWQAQAVYDCQRAELTAAQQVLVEAQAIDRAFAEQLKQSVRVQIASMAKDPAVTDAIFKPDQKPYWHDQIEPPSDGQEAGVSRP